jgi:hypothetical protein
MTVSSASIPVLHSAEPACQFPSTEQASAGDVGMVMDHDPNVSSQFVKTLNYF